MTDGDNIASDPDRWERMKSTCAILQTQVDAADADTSGFEPVWSGGGRVGLVTSGGHDHTIGKSLLALVEPPHAVIGSTLTVHVVGVERSARVIASSPYDPAGQALRR